MFFFFVFIYERPYNIEIWPRNRRFFCGGKVELVKWGWAREEECGEKMRPYRANTDGQRVGVLTKDVDDLFVALSLGSGSAYKQPRNMCHILSDVIFVFVVFHSSVLPAFFTPFSVPSILYPRLYVEVRKYCWCGYMCTALSEKKVRKPVLSYIALL